MVRGKWILASCTAILVGVAVGALSLLRQRAPQPQSTVAAPPTSAAVDSISLEGLVRARHFVPIPAPVEGTLEAVYVGIGEQVFQNQLLAQIKNSDLEMARDIAVMEAEKAQTRVNGLESSQIAARLEASRAGADAARARGEFERAEKAAQRQQMLYREGATPRLVHEKVQKEYEAAKSEYEILRQLAEQAEQRSASLLRDIEAARLSLEESSKELESAQTDVLAAQIRSPVDGVLIGARAKAGDPVHQSMEDLFQIAVDVNLLEAVVEPDPTVLARIRQGQAAEIRLAELPNEALPAEVREVKDGQVVVEFTSSNPMVKPGVTAQVRIRLT